MRKNEKHKIIVCVLVAVMAVTALAPVYQIKAETVSLSNINNTFDTAYDLNFNSSIAETLSASDMKRYYKFSLREASALNLSFDAYSTGEGLKVYVYDKSRTSVFYKQSGIYTKQFSFNDIYLTGGDYYLGIEYAYPYSMFATVDSLNESFTETQDANNDIVSNASAISFSKKYKGVLAYNDANDYYKFTLPEASNVTISVTNSTSDKLKYTFYYSSVNPAYFGTVKQAGTAEETITLAAGNYYLAMAKEADTANGSYSFSLSRVKVTETNNTADKTTATAASKITVKPPTILSVRNTASRKMTVKWKKVSGISGYQLQYATNKNFKKGVKTKNISAGKKSTKCSNLKKKRKYYVRMRTYVILDGTRIYSNWSTIKNRKIRK